MKAKLVLLGIIFLLNIDFAKADILESSTTVFAGGTTLSLDMEIDTDLDLVTLTMTGPESQYFAFGFGGTSMNGTYTIVMEGSGSVFEQKLGNQWAGSGLASSITVVSNTTSGGERTVVLTRAITGITGDHFTFPSVESNINFIFARGNGSSFSYHGSANKGVSSTMTTLPVSLKDFKVTREGRNKVLLTWNTASEWNNDRFIVERSCDGQSWEKEGEVMGKGNSQKELVYTFIDNTPMAGINYYRLKQIDFDGKFNYSLVRGIEFYNTNINENIKVYPTIISSFLNFSMQNIFEGKAKIQIYNASFLSVKNIWWDSEENNLKVSIDDLNPGYYYVIIKHSDWQVVSRIIKE